MFRTVLPYIWCEQDNESSSYHTSLQLQLCSGPLEMSGKINRTTPVLVVCACPDFVTTLEYQDLGLANSSLKEQLISALEELGARELEAGELHDAGLKTQAKMQSFVDQVGCCCSMCGRSHQRPHLCVQTCHTECLLGMVA